MGRRTALHAGVGGSRGLEAREQQRVLLKLHAAEAVERGAREVDQQHENAERDGGRCEVLSQLVRGLVDAQACTCWRLLQRIVALRPRVLAA